MTNFQLTITSVISIILFSFCFALFLAVMLRNDKLLSRVKYELLLLCLAAPIIKILIPVEILPWTHNINVHYVLPQIVIFINKKIAIIGERKITIWDMVLAFLFVGTIVCAVRVVVSYLVFKREVEKLPEVDNPNIYKLMDGILAEQGEKAAISLKWTSGAVTPRIFGVLKPYILIPKIEMSETELESVLRHEIAHHLHGDLVLRWCWILIKIICWWNPAVYILDGQFEKLLEIRADENAVKNQRIKVETDYMQTLVVLSTEAAGKKSSEFCASYQEKKGISAKRRVKIMLDRSTRKRGSFLAVNMMAAICVALLAVGMNCFIFEPISRDTDDGYAEGPMASEDNSFWIKNQDGTYDMYFDGKYRTTLDDTYGSDLPIYDSLEEALKYEENR